MRCWTNFFWGGGGGGGGSLVLYHSQRFSFYQKPERRIHTWSYIQICSKIFVLEILYKFIWNIPLKNIKYKWKNLLFSFHENCHRLTSKQIYATSVCFINSRPRSEFIQQAGLWFWSYPRPPLHLCYYSKFKFSARISLLLRNQLKVQNSSKSAFFVKKLLLSTFWHLYCCPNPCPVDNLLQNTM